jgi:ketosteroid isomerase-like protein
MGNNSILTSADPSAAQSTAAIVGRFIDAFQQKNVAAIPDLVASDCVMEAMQPAPDGLRVEGYAANVAFWQAMVKDPAGTFEVEDLVIAGDLAINRWRYRFGAGALDTLRGVTLLRVRNGKITEALGYAKTPPVSDLGQASTSTAYVVQRYNEAFARHEPELLRDLIAADCVIENTTPAPDGDRHVGHDACFALWQRIAGNPELHFDVEDVEVFGNSATIRWHLRWGQEDQQRVRGVNLLRLRDGQIVEARGYVKSG